MKIAKPIQSLIESFSKLLALGQNRPSGLYYLLHVPQTQLDDFQSPSRELKDTVLCSVCKNVSETDPCPICDDPARDHSTIMVVEQPLDLVAFERSGKFKGVYHVLHGAINPLENIGPDEVYIEPLLDRIRNQESGIRELIISTNPTMEGSYINVHK